MHRVWVQPDGLARNDSRGRPLSAHSARKWFKTELVRAGVHADLIDRLMRHRTGVGQRYYDPTIQEQAAALALLPKNLWPEVVGQQRVTTLSPKSVAKAVDTGGAEPTISVARPMMKTLQLTTPRPAGPVGLATDLAGRERGSALSGLNGADPVSGDRPQNGEVGSAPWGSNSGEAAGDNPAADRWACSSARPVGERAPGERPGLPISQIETALAEGVMALARLVRRRADQ